MAINDALEKEDAQETLRTLKNPPAMMQKVEPVNAERYQTSLLQAKKNKEAKSGIFTEVCGIL